MNQLAQKAVCILELIRTPYKCKTPLRRAGLANRGVEGGSNMILSVFFTVLILTIGLRGVRIKIDIDL
jgi:hypothetical protein